MLNRLICFFFGHQKYWTNEDGWCCGRRKCYWMARDPDDDLLPYNAMTNWGFLVEDYHEQ